MITLSLTLPNISKVSDLLLPPSSWHLPSCGFCGISSVSLIWSFRPFFLLAASSSINLIVEVCTSKLLSFLGSPTSCSHTVLLQEHIYTHTSMTTYGLSTDFQMGSPNYFWKSPNYFCLQSATSPIYHLMWGKSNSLCFTEKPIPIPLLVFFIYELNKLTQPTNTIFDHSSLLLSLSFYFQLGHNFYELYFLNSPLIFPSLSFS